MKRMLLLLGLLAAACGGHATIGFTDSDTGAPPPPPPPPDNGSDSSIDPGDASLDATKPPPSTKFFLMVTETPPGDAPLNTWGGVARYELADDFANATTGKGIPANLVADPCGLAFRSRSAELFVGNRHGNTGADGVLGSISRFTYDKNTQAFTAHGTITGNGLARVHQVTFDPKENELFAANRDTDVSRFKFDMNGNPIPNGVISTNGPTRGVAVSPDGKRLYVTTASYIIRMFDLSNGATEVTPAVSVPETNADLHFMLVTGSELYVPGATNNITYRYKIQSDDSLTLEAKVTGDTPISVAISPSLKELFAAGHVNSYVVDRYKDMMGTWAQEQNTIQTGWSMGSILAFPYESTPDNDPYLPK